jgi:hypothetical protein
VYETQDGRLQLVGVEYLVKVEDWPKNNPLPPTLFGQGFTYSGSPNRYGLSPFYALHVWTWRDDPHGDSRTGIRHRARSSRPFPKPMDPRGLDRLDSEHLSQVSRSRPSARQRGVIKQCGLARRSRSTL